MILCFSLISSRRRASCLWWRPRWESPCWRIFWKWKEQISLQRCQLQRWKLKSQVISKKAHHVFENIRCFSCILFWGERMHMSEFQQISSYNISYLHVTILSFTLLSLFFFLHRVIWKPKKAFTHRITTLNLQANSWKIFFMRVHGTLVLQLGQLLAQRIVALLQLPLLLLHALHVLRQRADLGLVLYQHKCTHREFIFIFFLKSNIKTQQWQNYKTKSLPLPVPPPLTWEMRSWQEESSLPVSSILRWHSSCMFSSWRQRFTMLFTSDLILLM